MATSLICADVKVNCAVNDRDDDDDDVDSCSLERKKFNGAQLTILQSFFTCHHPQL